MLVQLRGTVGILLLGNATLPMVRAVMSSSLQAKLVQHVNKTVVGAFFRLGPTTTIDRQSPYRPRRWRWWIRIGRDAGVRDTASAESRAQQQEMLLYELILLTFAFAFALAKLLISQHFLFFARLANSISSSIRRLGRESSSSTGAPRYCQRTLRAQAADLIEQQPLVGCCYLRERRHPDRWSEARLPTRADCCNAGAIRRHLVALREAAGARSLRQSHRARRRRCRTSGEAGAIPEARRDGRLGTAGELLSGCSSGESLV